MTCFGGEKKKKKSRTEPEKKKFPNLTVLPQLPHKAILLDISILGLICTFKKKKKFGTREER